MCVTTPSATLPAGKPPRGGELPRSGRPKGSKGTVGVEPTRGLTKTNHRRIKDEHNLGRSEHQLADSRVKAWATHRRSSRLGTFLVLPPALNLHLRIHVPERTPCLRQASASLATISLGTLQVAPPSRALVYRGMSNGKVTEKLSPARQGRSLRRHAPLWTGME